MDIQKNLSGDPFIYGIGFSKCTIISNDLKKVSLIITMISSIGR